MKAYRIMPMTLIIMGESKCVILYNAIMLLELEMVRFSCK